MGVLSSPESGIGRGILLKKAGELTQIQLVHADDNLSAADYMQLAVDVPDMQHFEFTGDF
jgi:hypothetical protein